ncbi:MAG: hypothetical protein HY825_00025, partial [Acidobacteria bacterium]|nr:hypothetical protein [Acidobacteriota bacterium]
GIPLDPVPASIAVLEGEPGLFTRRYEDGVVMVNATSAADGTARTYHVALPAAAYLVEASGGGAVGGDGRPSGTLQTRAVDGIDLGPGRGAVLLRRSLTHAVRRHLPRGR